MGTVFCLVAAICLAQTPAPQAAGADLEPLLKTLRAVASQGVGNREASRAWEQLAKADAVRLPAILAGLDQANVLAANWIRTAVDAIAERQLQRGGALPVAGLTQFVRDPQHAPRARRLAYEWLVRVDPSAEQRLIPDMLNDTSLELRRDAVARLIREAAGLSAAGKAPDAATVYRRALTAARDPDQIRQLADCLRKQGETIDLPRFFGFLVRWKAIGPFDNRGRKGFDAVFPPEKEASFAASYPGKHGTVKWIEVASADDYGMIDLNKALGEEKEVAGYAAAEFYSSGPREVEFRLTSFNAMKLWLNGVPVGQFPVYHSGSQLDQYVARGSLQPGRNLILIKVCQNEQTQEWARGWGFQLRVCDSLGGAVLSTDRK